MIDALQEEIRGLREENSRLRADGQRPIDPHALRVELDDLALASSVAAAPDGVRQGLIDVEVTREGLLDVCARLQVVAGQLHRQLAERVAAPEIDRRVVDLTVADGRRSTDRPSGSRARVGADPSEGDTAPGDRTASAPVPRWVGIARAVPVPSAEYGVHVPTAHRDRGPGA